MLLFTFQLLILALIVVSLLLVISVPVTFALPNGWKENKNYIVWAITAWTSLVFAIGGLNYFIS